MKLTALYTDEHAVSDVIGTVLIVAVTVVIAAAVVTFFIQISQQPQEVPQAAFDFDYQSDDSAPIREKVTIRHLSGEAVDASQVSILVEGAATPSSVVNDRYTWRQLDADTPDEVVAGESVNVSRRSLRPTSPYNQLSLDSANVELIWTSPDGSQSFTLAEWEKTDSG